MNLKHLQARRTSSRILITACVVLLCLLSLAWRFHALRPRVWKPAEVKIAFWAWRNETPTQAEVERGRDEAHAETLFLRAGQIDVERETMQRIRPVKGAFPRGVELHLVYNGTPALLTNFEQLDAALLASVVSETYKRDAARAAQDGASVAGLQLDLDVPTRLLSRYAQVLRLVRAQLPPRTKLSITGLPTWIDSAQIEDVLASVDFWTPQCYGASLPDEVQKIIPIASARGVAQAIAHVRNLGHPFYAGIPAYGYALLYSSNGKLVNLRGDLDPARLAQDRNFELIERRPFEAEAQGDDQAHGASEWRYVYRAVDDGVTDGLAVHAGDLLVLDLPSAEAFRSYARAVREEAGDKLLGVCVFRLPVREDATTLALEQIAAALKNVPLQIKTEVSISKASMNQTDKAAHGESDAKGEDNAKRIDDANSEDEAKGNATNRGEVLSITATNRGTMSTVMGDDALALTLRVPAGSVREVASLDGFTSFETLCAGDETSAPRRCGLMRANVLRLKARSWMAGASGQARIIVRGRMPDALDANIATLVDDGRRRESPGSVSVATDERR